MGKRGWIILSLLFLASFGFAQNPGGELETPSSFSDIFLHGEFSAKVRWSYMQTFNDGDLKDPYTFSLGLRPQFETAPIFGFSLGAGANLVLPVYSEGLYNVGGLTGKKARWEIEQYDYIDKTERAIYSRLESLFLRYKKNDWEGQIGYFDFNEGPLFLRRDGRMMSFLFRGTWISYQHKNGKLKGAWINGVAPRGTTNWFSMDEAIGINNNGQQPDGSEAHYRDLTPIKGLAMLSSEYNFGNTWRWQSHYFYFHRLFHMSWNEVSYKKNDWYTGLQYVVQGADGYQDDLEYADRYMQPSEVAHVFSGRAGKKLGTWDFSLAYLYSASEGRFLFPRELGRENFFVSQPRSWIDGFGKSQVGMVRVKWNSKQLKGLGLDWRGSYTQTPGQDELAFNKYGWNSFYQSTMIVRYAMEETWGKLSFMLLYVGKFLPANTDLDQVDKYYRYDIHHFNLIIDYSF